MVCRQLVPMCEFIAVNEIDFFFIYCPVTGDKESLAGVRVG
jgi:hypothetical protein